MRSPSTLRARITGVQLVVTLVGLGALYLVSADRLGTLRGPFLLVSVAILVATAAASSLVAGWIARSLQLLALDLGRIARGHADRVTASGPAEAVRLADAINGMADELAGVIDELRAETGLREQILASMREGVVLADSYGELIYANQAAYDMFGRRPRDLLPAQLAVPGDHDVTVHHPRRRELRSTSVRLEDGRMLVVIQDETERKRVESIRRDFVANASHELKTPVSAIMVTAETVERAMGDDPENARRFAANLVREARRLSALVQDLLDLARLERGQGERSEVRLGEVVEDEVDSLRERIERKGLRLEVALDRKISALGVREDLALMVRNLLENALGYTAEGSIRVELSDTGEGFALRVSDTGAGIPTTDLERIFERFYRVDKARSRDTGGTGLGLAIVRHVAESHGGVVEVASELGSGSTFTVRLPYPR
ncbi:MAG TPA: ATP-binding protein [Actinomycetota bacterium]|nr:ATP-binding protein [Actinomycetota bacterium]